MNLIKNFIKKIEASDFLLSMGLISLTTGLFLWMWQIYGNIILAVGVALTVFAISTLLIFCLMEILSSFVEYLNQKNQ